MLPARHRESTAPAQSERAPPLTPDGVSTARKPERPRTTDGESLRSDLRHALARREFQVHYQPRVDFRSNEIVGVEALLRWHHSGRGPLLAAQFVTVAEDCGLMPEIGDWVRTEVCRHLRAWLAHGLGLRVAVNVSAAELRSIKFVTEVELLLVRSGVAPSDLMFEVTESGFLQAPALTAAVLRELRALGLHVALDNFGPGYLALPHLEELPLDGLNIDQSFVREAATDPADGCMLSALIAAATGLQLRILAAGVQSEAQCAYLREQRCTQGQGFYLGKPLPAGELLRYLLHPAPLSLSEAFPPQHLVCAGPAIHLEPGRDGISKSGPGKKRKSALAPPIVGSVAERDHYTPSMARQDARKKVRLGASRATP
jgi:EAL domain-containing protein (putative c-di-GMP-specific phosphodiesterase class I)